MSGQATGWVLRHGPCTAWASRLGCRKDRSGQAVLTAIADAANRDGENAHPGIAAMEDASGYARATVFAALARLERAGWIEVTEDGGGRGRATVYRIPGVTDPRWRPIGTVQESDPQTVSDLDPETVQEPDPESVLPSDPSEGETVQISTPKGSSSDPETVQISESAPITQRFTNGKQQRVDPASTGTDSFEAFWVAVPKRVGKGAARTAWKAAIRKADPALIVAGMRRYADEVRGSDPRYIKHPATWLRSECWTDEAGVNQRGRPATGQPIDEDRDRPSGVIDPKDL